MLEKKRNLGYSHGLYWERYKRVIMTIVKKAKIALEDGRIFTGFSFGANGEKFGEIVFNTSMAGYQEIITDPSYKSQIITMTYPLIGNYGVNEEDIESKNIFAQGLIVKECSSIDSNWRSQKKLDRYLKENGILGIAGVDTRALTRHIRLQGAMKAVISTEDLDEKSLIEKAKASPGLIGRDLVKEVTTDKIYDWNEKGSYRIVVVDCGVKLSILKNLEKNNCQVRVVPYYTSAEKIMAENPQGLLISNGPGDPAAVKFAAETVKKLIGKIPIFGICLGHQILGLAMGGKTYKLKFGHRGGNHPVKDVRTGKIAITAQNHGFCVDITSLNENEIEITHINLNDNTLEGMRHRSLPVFSVQFHPESSPGPHDANYLFHEFIGVIKNNI